MSSPPLFVFMMFLIPVFGMGTALLIAALQSIPRPVAARATRSRRSMPHRPS
jgi:hypothetical protein